MVLNPMFKGKNNSPKARITSQIDTTSTTIPVSEIDFFPEGPNLATIGTDENAEVIKYNGKSGNNLTGCERGFGGTIANTWPIDSYIYRAFTTYDHDTFIDNFELMRDAKHAAKHAFGGYDPITITKNQISDFPLTMPPSVHNHNIMTLDNYKSGSFNPIITFLGNNTTSLTYNSRLGTYVKIGSMVFIGLYLYVTNINPAASGSIRIDGLPFASIQSTAIPLARTSYPNIFGVIGKAFTGGTNTGLVLKKHSNNEDLNKSDIGSSIIIISSFFYFG